MSNISAWSSAAASNNAATPDGWPEGQAPSTVNNCGREMMAAVRSWYEVAQWVNFGFTPTRTGDTTFTLSGDQTVEYHVGRRIKTSGSATTYATISVSSYGAPNTTVTVVNDGAVLPTPTLSTVSLGALSYNNPSLPRDYPLVLSAHKTADTSRNTTTSAAADPHLTLTTAANKRYYVVIRCVWDNTTTTTQGIRVALTTPASSTFFGTAKYSITSSVSGEVRMSESTVIDVDPGSAADLNYFWIDGVLDVTTAGTFAFAWAQNASSANNTTVYARNSMISLTALN